MINRSLGPLYEKLDTAHDQMRSARTPEERLAMANYIGNIYRSLICMGDADIQVDRYRCFGGRKNYNKFIKKLDVYSDQLLHNFVMCKDFHADYLGEILPSVEEEMSEFCCMAFPEEEALSEKDFFELYYLFLDSLGLAKQFDEFYKNCHVHSTIVGQDKGNLGFTLYNPLSGETDLFVKDMKFTFSCMNTLAHEFGHGMDLKGFTGDVEEYNRYFYLSFYGEVFSRLMERLLHRYFLKNGLMIDTVKDKFIDFESLNHDFLLQSYILSLLDSTFLLNERYMDGDSETIANKVKKHFLDDADIKGFLERMEHIDLSESFTYAYGDILSLFLCDEVEKCGFSSDLFEYFMKNRTSIFQEGFLREAGFGPGNYKKLYKKEAELIKK